MYCLHNVGLKVERLYNALSAPLHIMPLALLNTYTHHLTPPTPQTPSHLA